MERKRHGFGARREERRLRAYGRMNQPGEDFAGFFRAVIFIVLDEPAEERVGVPVRGNDSIDPFIIPAAGMSHPARRGFAATRTRDRGRHTERGQALSASAHPFAPAAHAMDRKKSVQERSFEFAYFPKIKLHLNLPELPAALGADPLFSLPAGRQEEGLIRPPPSYSHSIQDTSQRPSEFLSFRSKTV
jgi:hypothetical protein